MYSVNINSHAERELKRLDRTTKNRIVTASLALANDPRPAGCLKVKTSEDCGGFASAIGASGTKSMTRPSRSQSSPSVIVASSTIEAAPIPFK
jgi:hypothetical protein